MRAIEHPFRPGGYEGAWLCLDCGEPDRLHPERPHRGDAIYVYEERRTVLDLIDRGMGLLVVADDEAGMRIERYADRLTWDEDARAWRAVA